MRRLFVLGAVIFGGGVVLIKLLYGVSWGEAVEIADQFVEDGDMVRFEATVAHLEGSVHQVYGVFVMAKGRIARYLPGQIADLNGAH